MRTNRMVVEVRATALVAAPTCSPAYLLPAPSLLVCAPSVHRRALSIRLCTPSIRVCAPSLRLCTPSIRLCAPSIQLCAPANRFCAPSVHLCALSIRLCTSTKINGRRAETISWRRVRLWSGRIRRLDGFRAILATARVPRLARCPLRIGGIVGPERAAN